MQDVSKCLFLYERQRHESMCGRTKLVCVCVCVCIREREINMLVFEVASMFSEHVCL